jgi:hypothetical protein
VHPHTGVEHEALCGFQRLAEINLGNALKRIPVAIVRVTPILVPTGDVPYCGF